jgi:ankyrin repeat protein
MSTSLAIVETLLKAGSDANEIDPLEVLGPRYLSILEALLAHGADPNHVFANEREREVTPLQYAAERGDLAAVRVLLKARARPDVADANRETALHAAVHGALYSRRQYGAPPTSTFVDIVSLLLNAGANVNARDRHGLTPLSATVGNASTIPEIVEFLRAHGGTE